jgi:hypothetical protein
MRYLSIVSPRSNNEQLLERLYLELHAVATDAAPLSDALAEHAPSVLTLPRYASQTDPATAAAADICSLPDRLPTDLANAVALLFRTDGRAEGITSRRESAKLGGGEFKWYRNAGVYRVASDLLLASYPIDPDQKTEFRHLMVQKGVDVLAFGSERLVDRFSKDLFRSPAATCQRRLWIQWELEPLVAGVRHFAFDLPISGLRRHRWVVCAPPGAEPVGVAPTRPGADQGPSRFLVSLPEPTRIGKPFHLTVRFDLSGRSEQERWVEHITTQPVDELNIWVRCPPGRKVPFVVRAHDGPLDDAHLIGQDSVRLDDNEQLMGATLWKAQSGQRLRIEWDHDATSWTELRRTWQGIWRQANFPHRFKPLDEPPLFGDNQ